MSDAYLTQAHALQQLIDSQNRFQQAMAESHVAFLNAFTQLTHAVASHGAALPANATLPSPVLATPPVLTAPALMMPMPAMPAPMSTYAPPAAPINMPPQVAPPVAMPTPSFNPAPMVPTPAFAPLSQLQAAAPPVATTPTAAQPAAPVAATTTQTDTATTQDPEALLLQVVAEKTGYPTEMLNPQMSIEADLGIDSIKRVEILSTLAQRMPNLPEISSSIAAQLQTLGDIVNYMKKHAVAH